MGKDGVGRIVSVRVGLVVRHPRPKWDKASGTTWASAYVKSPVNGSVHVGPEGIEGDQQHDRRAHGGTEMAVLAYADSHYDEWRDELDLVEMGPGGFGENLTVEGFDESTVCIGDVWATGEARLQIASPRGPCSNISRRWDRQDLMQKVIDTARGGWYLRVLQPGSLSARQPVRRIERPQPDWSVERVFRLFYGEQRDAKDVTKIAKIKELAPYWREKFAALGRAPASGEEVSLNRNGTALLVSLAMIGGAHALPAWGAGAPAAASKPAVSARPAAGASTTNGVPGVREVLPPGRLTVDIMEMTAPPRLAELGTRFQQALRKDPEWAMAQVKKAPPGQPLPYDPRFGLTKAEYDEYLSLGKQLTMRKKSEAALTVIRKNESTYALDGGTVLADLTGIEFDLKADVVRTKFGVLKDRVPVDINDGTVLGPWRGAQWKLEAPNPDGVTGTIAKLGLGKLKASGRGILYFEVTSITRTAPQRLTRVLSFDIRPAR